MTPGKLSRRSFIAAAVGAATVGPIAAPLSAGLLPRADAADNQANLANLVDLRFGMFNHFNLGTFTNEEWAAGHQSPALFAPSTVDCGQWADAAFAAKMSFGVLTTKHHDGFSLWPSAYGTQNVAYSGYKQDVVAQYVNAFRARGLKIGLYYSIWDRTHTVESYGGHVDDPTQSIEPENLTFILGQITELLSNYGTIDIFVTDGYAWQMGQQAVSYQLIREKVRSLQPNCVMIDHGGLSQPWLGDAIYFEEPLGITSPAGNTYAGIQGQTISNGWFWHPSTPTESLMSRSAIVSHLGDLEPKWTTFLLNCPPNRNGVLDTNIVNRLTDVGTVWNRNDSRAALPFQPLKVERPVNLVNAYATGYHAGEPPLSTIDGRSDSGFETCWSTWSTTPGQGTLALPQSVTIDLGGVWSNVSTLQYLPKQWNRNNVTDGDITTYTVSVSTDGVSFTQVASGNWAGDRTPKIAEWTNRDVGFVRLTAIAATGDYSNVSGLRIGGRSATPALVSRFPLAATVYRLVNRKSGEVVDVYNRGTANGSNIQQWPWNNEPCQKWTFISTGDGYFKIRDQNSGKLMEVAGLSRAEGGNVALWADASAFQQHWAVTPTGDGYYFLTNRFSGLALTVAGASTADGANIDQATYNPTSTNQHWQLLGVQAVTLSATPDATAVAYGATARVQLRATSADPTADANPSGTITVLDGTRQIGTETLSANGKGTATLTGDLPVGTHSLTVLYSGDADFGPSSTTFPLTVTRAATTTALSLNKTSIGPGQDARADIEVSSETRATIAGTVTLTVSGPGTETATQTGALDSKNRAKIDIGPFTTTGTLTVTATFPGTIDNQPSTSTSQAVTVTP